MKALGRWSVDNRVAVNLVMVFVIIAGLFALLRMRREMFPQYALDMINISVPYPGASPMEVEEGICIKIEENTKGIEGIRRMYANAYEGLGSVTVELEEGLDTQKVLDDIKSEVERITTFPDNAEKPLITEIVNRNPAIYVAVYGEVSEKELRGIAEGIRDELVDTDAISLAEVIGVRNYEISVTISEENMRKYALSFDQIVAALRSGSLDLPGGVIKTPGGDMLLRAKGQRYTGEELAALPLITLPGGTVLRLGQIARVIDGFDDSDVRARFNGQPGAIVAVNRTDTEDTIRISETVRDYTAGLKAKLPPDVHVALWGDLSLMVRDRIDLLVRNGIQGIILVFLLLALFLELGLAFWVSMGIPVSFMGAFLVLQHQGASINMISLFAFIMTLGILVDDAIIVGENIFTHYHRGKPPRQAVLEGFSEVAWPVVMAVGTTVVAFMPLMFIDGILGKFIAIMPQAVIVILVVSLGEALIILPAHLNHALGAARMRTHVSRHERLRRKIEILLTRTIEQVYLPALRYVVQNRYFTFTMGLAVLIVSLGMVKSGYVPFVFFPKAESNWIIAEVSYPLGTPLHVTQKAVAHIERQAFALNHVFEDRVPKGQPTVQNTFALTGVIPRRDWKPAEYGAHCGQVWIELISSQERESLPVTEVLSTWRRQVGNIAGVDKLTFATLEGGPGGNPIEIQLSGGEFDLLSKAAEALKAEIATYPGTYDISDDFRPGKPEKQVHIRESARPLGVSLAAVARRLRQAFYGEEALRIQRGKHDIKVMVRYEEKDRRSLAGLEQMRIRTPDGREIPIQVVADIIPGRAYSVIHRIERKRVITVISDLDENIANAGEIVADLNRNFLPALKRQYPGLTYDLSGQERRTREAMASIGQGYLLALMGIFLLLAGQFRSYVQPVIIMLAIPFGLIGAVLGHLLMGLDLTMVSIFGIVALSGIVVNDALILIDFINRAIERGMDVQQAVIESGRDRFRPVLLTSITTIAGLFPLLLERSFQAQFLIPMAVSISFGLLAATVLTLLFVPALYLIVRDLTPGTSNNGQSRQDRQPI